VAGTEGPVKLPLVVTLDQRGSALTTDARTYNCLAEKHADGEHTIAKRPGFYVYATDNSGKNIGNGFYYWAQKNEYWAVIDGSLVKTFATLPVGAVSSAAGYWFNETLGTPYYLYLSNGVAGYTVSSAGAFAQIVDPNYPAVTVPGSAYLDGTIYVMDLQGRIWGTTNLNDPTAWSATNMVRASSDTDLGIALARQATYVVAFKQWSTEFFYDAGNYAGTSTGSTLLPVQNAKLPVGCSAPETVRSLEDNLFWMGSSRGGAPAIFKLSRLQMTRISTPPVERLLIQSYSAKAWTTRLNGHSLYVLPLPSGPDLVYDDTVGMWYFWSYTYTGFSPTASLPISYSASDGLQTFFQGATGGVFYNFSATSYNDGTPGVVGGPNLPLVVDIITPIFDGGVQLRKTLTKLTILADQLGGGFLKVRWSDDDYKTWSNWQTVNLQDSLPQLTNLGTFRRRAFHFQHSSPTAFRMSSVDLHILLGTT
jgi:hypothetical protein